MAKGTTATGITSIIPTKGFILPPLWIGAVALLLLWFGTPALVARLSLLPGDSARGEVVEGRPVSQAEVEVMRQSRLATAGWYPLSNSYNDLALSAFNRGGETKSKEEAQVHFTEAEAWERAALGLSPVDPFGWFRLAYLSFVADGGKPSARTAAAWAQSLSAGPYEPTLMLARLQMGFSHLPFLTPEAKSHIPRLIRGAAIFDAEGLARLAKASFTTTLVEEALVGDEAALRAFRERIGKM